MSEDTIKKVEAILFAVGRAISVQELSELAKESPAEIKHALQELKKQYVERGSPLLVMEETDSWKLTVHEKYLSFVQQINPHTELSKSILETLAVIAWKQPARQSDVIKIRTNKAYEHVDELEKLGFVSKEKYGRSFLLKVTSKFFDYFDLPGEKGVREIFKDVKDIGEAQAKLLDQEAEKELGLHIYESHSDKKEAAKEHLGELEVFEDVDNEESTESEEELEEAPSVSEEDKSAQMIKSLSDEDPIEGFLKENKKPAPQEVEEGLAEEVSEEKEEESTERQLDPELEEVIKDK